MKENKMAVMPVRRLLLNMAWPMALSMLVQALYNLVDSLFVARLGESGFVALSLVFPVQVLMIAVCVGTGVGFNALLSRYLGMREEEKAVKTTSNGYFIYFICWLVFAITGALFSRPFLHIFSADAQTVEYGAQYLAIVTVGSVGLCLQFASERTLQATGDTVRPMIIQSLGAVINLILDPLLIFGIGPFPRLEAAGAALATVIGQIIGAVAGILMVRRNKIVRLSFKKFRPSADIAKNIFKIGVPAIFVQALATVMTMGMNYILPFFTASGVFIQGAYFKLQAFVFMPVNGMNNALIPIVSFNYGAGNTRRITGVVRFAVFIAVVIMAAGTLIFIAFPSGLLRMFNADASVITEGISALRAISVSFVFAGVSIILCAALQALGAAVSSLIVSLLRQVVFLFPFALISGLIDPSAVWFSFLAAEIFSCIAALLLYRRACSKMLYAHKTAEHGSR